MPDDDDAGVSPAAAADPAAADPTATDDAVCEVEAIVGQRVSRQSGVQYRVRWKGWEGRDTWEPRENLAGCNEALQAFLSRGQPPSAGHPPRRTHAEDPPPRRSRQPEAIVDQRMPDDELQYRVRWEGRGADADTWEPSTSLQGHADLVDTFWSHGSQPAAAAPAAAGGPVVTWACGACTLHNTTGPLGSWSGRGMRLSHLRIRSNKTKVSMHCP
eukprot:COSAG06_NODE_4305_length_4378_cov_7.242113_1_plen_215_part_00